LRKIMLHVEFLYQTISMIFAWFALVRCIPTVRRKTH
jgi:hypothetical protein